jgi:hypothetical protein
MHDFAVTTGNSTNTFRFGIDFVDGEDRFCWTASGLEKLIVLGLWERRLDRRGTVLEKPPTVEQLRRAPGARPMA